MHSEHLAKPVLLPEYHYCYVSSPSLRLSQRGRRDGSVLKSMSWATGRLTMPQSICGQHSMDLCFLWFCFFSFLLSFFGGSRMGRSQGRRGGPGKTGSECDGVLYVKFPNNQYIYKMLTKTTKRTSAALASVLSSVPTISSR